MFAVPGNRPAALVFTALCTTADPRAVAVDACLSGATRGLSEAEFLDTTGENASEVPSATTLRLVLQKRTAECLGAAYGVGTNAHLEINGPELWYRPTPIVWVVDDGGGCGCHEVGMIDAYTGGIRWANECLCCFRAVRGYILLSLPR